MKQRTSAKHNQEDADDDFFAVIKRFMSTSGPLSRTSI
jgi:hypothetical protein